MYGAPEIKETDMRFSKPLSAVFAGMLAFALSGCAGQTTEVQDEEVLDTVENTNAQEITITESGFNVGNDGNVTYAFIANSPNDGFIANSVVFSIEGYDDQGNRVLGSAESIDRMYPGVDTAFAGSAYMVESSNLVRLDVVASMDNVVWTQTDLTADQVDDMFSLVNTRNIRDVDGSAVVSGRVVANDLSLIAQCEGVSEDQISATLTVLLVNTQGELVAGTSVSDLDFSGEEGVVHETEDMGTTARSNEEAAEESAEGDMLRSASFSASIPDAPGYKECRFFVQPS